MFSRPRWGSLIPFLMISSLLSGQAAIVDKAAKSRTPDVLTPAPLSVRKATREELARAVAATAVGPSVWERSKDPQRGHSTAVVLLTVAAQGVLWSSYFRDRSSTARALRYPGVRETNPIPQVILPLTAIFSAMSAASPFVRDKHLGVLLNCPALAGGFAKHLAANGNNKLAQRCAAGNCLQ